MPIGLILEKCHTHTSPLPILTKLGVIKAHFSQNFKFINERVAAIDPFVWYHVATIYQNLAKSWHFQIKIFLQKIYQNK